MPENEEKTKSTVPKNSCLITLMFAIDNDKQAFDMKEQINKLVQPIEQKRFTFTIEER